jgi:protein-disulfide isomerase
LDREADICENQGVIRSGESPVSRKQIFIALGVVLVLVLGGLAWFLTSNADSNPAGTEAGGYTLQPYDRMLGNKNSKVVLIEYFAPSCPVCAAFSASGFPQIKAKYIDTGKINYVLRVFPLRPDDGAAEKIARCLPEDKYLPFIDLLFKNQPKWDVEYGVQSPEGVHDGLVLVGRIAGMSREQVDQCIANKAEDDRINKVATEGESRYRITGTPTFVLNGVNVGSGNMAPEALSKLIDAELAKQ